MKFIADFHVHSKFSRATAKNLDLENLYIAAQIKGVTVVGTGDFTYPGWFSEISEKLQPAEPGLFKLKDEYAIICDKKVPLSCRAEVRFILSTEISNIYKKNAKTRKNHNLIMVPDLAVTEKFNAKLDKIGNIKSDGRPILGLDARDLFEILLETSDEAFLIPAHIWTPWFSVLGSKSGFDSLEECFEDLTPNIFAVETGLSSDPPMNWRVSGLDGLTLVSNSDAHSPLNLGREANLLNTDLSFKAIKSALKSGDPDQFLGTFEFFPEEGKYHFDGHRTCNVRLHPQETMENKGKCPVCGKDLTIGVLYRVEELADRGQDQTAPNRHPYYSMVQLVDILSEIFKVGAKSKKVLKNYQTAINELGSESNILHTLEPEVIDGAGIPLLGEAIRRTRNKEIEVLPGYDGEYGQVLIFRANERERLMGQKALFSIPAPPPIQPESVKKRVAAGRNQFPLELTKKRKSPAGDSTNNPAAVTAIDKLNSEQRRAVNHPGGPLLIIAGPGTGKTRTLTHRIAHLIMEKGVSPQNILAVTFTNKAAAEMRARLNHLMGNPPSLPLVATFHSFCFSILNDQKIKPSGIVDEDHRRALISEAIKRYSSGDTQVDFKPREILHRIIAAKQQVLSPDEFAELHFGDSESEVISGIYRIYQQLLAIQGFCDFEDLIFNIVRLLESKSNQSRRYQKNYQHIYVDEYQDLNQAQYRIIRALAPDEAAIKDLCVIGDPDQSIYGFRGSDTAYFKHFVGDYPGAKVIRLTRNYRSTQTILKASFNVIQDHRLDSDDGGRTYSQIDGIKAVSILELTTEKAEAESIARIITQQIGGTGFHSIDTGIVTDANLVKARSYSDFAVLYRTHAQHQALADVFDKQGIPFQVASREKALNQAGLPELISFLKVIEGDGGFFDIEKIVQLALPGFGLSALGQFKDWCLQNRFALQEGLKKAVRFPVPGLKASRQQVLNDFSNQISQYKMDMSAMLVADRLRFLEKNTGLSRILNKDAAIREAFDGLIEFARHFKSDPTEFFAAVALHTDTDVYAHRVEKVSLMTMHAAKGLEFPVVFIAGCEQGFIPFKPHGGSKLVDMAEERRLFYVAMTRAMVRLYLTRAKKRRIYGQTELRVLSPFVADIENQLKKDETPLPKKKKTVTDHKQLKLF
ncbi:MAG: UvrD-helicase domain-containing protein [Desulfobacterales bacterium]